MKIIVTGAGGFIGTHLIQRLNSLGCTDIIAVDDNFRDTEVCIAVTDIITNLSHFYRNIPEADIIFHQGAITDTMESDRNKMYDYNFFYSMDLFNYSLQKNIPLIYASSAAVYGNSDKFNEIPRNEKPLNIYADSKLAFDITVRSIKPRNQVVGLRYFNVYGKHETHKGKMSSMIYQIYKQIKERGYCELFEYGNQRRDFVYVEDVVDVILYFMKRSALKGIYNVGTSMAVTFENVAQIVIHCLGYGEIKYIPMPDELKDKYQNCTQANINKLRKTGYKKEFTFIEDGIRKCVDYWNDELENKK